MTAPSLSQRNVQIKFSNTVPPPALCSHCKDPPGKQRKARSIGRHLEFDCKEITPLALHYHSSPSHRSTKWMRRPLANFQMG
mmetsp:Transcript_75970/g.222691  ORF Transcript_75970/g.222691 Transcript_75970/m.222691 type:complete len:82 (+) Transcript_75970:46-291(+)